MPLQTLPVITQAPGKLICQALLWSGEDSIQREVNNCIFRYNFGT